MGGHEVEEGERGKLQTGTAEVMPERRWMYPPQKGGWFYSRVRGYVAGLGG